MSALMPAIFIGHGNPLNAVYDNAFSRAWADVGQTLSRPEAIVSISAHWESVGTRVTAMPQPETLYDFQGFPQQLYEKRYPAPGTPELARRIKQEIRSPVIHLDFSHPRTAPVGNDGDETVHLSIEFYVSDCGPVVGFQRAAMIVESDAGDHRDDAIGHL